MTSRHLLLGLFAAVPLCLLAGCSSGASSSAPDDEATEDELRAPTAVVELALQPNGKCKMRSPNPRVKYNRVVRLKNVGDKPIAALIHLWDNFGGMPAPEGGDVAPGQFISVKMNTKWWALNDDPESREWSTEIVCRKGPWSDDSVDFDEVGRVDVYR
jgi:hypothetical protein